MLNFKTFGLCALAALLDGSVATTAPNFPIAGGQLDLTIAFGNNSVSPPGELIPRPETINPPTITTPAFTSGGNAVLLLVDIDVPRNGTRVQLLHWMIGNVTVASGNDSTLVFPPESQALAEYLQPSPPVGDVSHAYTALLFAQPANFSVPAQFNDVLQSRVFFDTAAFVQAAGLQSPLAANYFRVQNVSGTATQSFPPPASTPTNGSMTPSEPPEQSSLGAGAFGVKAWFVGAGTAVVASLFAILL